MCAVPTGTSTSNDTIIELIPHINFRRIGGRRYLLLPAFMLHTIPATSLTNWNPTGDIEHIVRGIKGKLSKIFEGPDDEGVEIKAYWHSSWLAVQAEEPKERLRRLNIELAGDAVVDVFVDYSDTVSFTKVLPRGAEEADIFWEGGKWEGGIWGGSTKYRFERVRPETWGRFHSIRFRTLSEGVPFQITTAELAIRGGKEH